MPKTAPRHINAIQRFLITVDEHTSEILPEFGVEWLLGDAADPKNLFDKNGRGDQGMWINPATGSLMIRNNFVDTEVHTGDWILVDPEGRLLVWQTRK